MKKIFYMFFLLLGAVLLAEEITEKNDTNITTETVKKTEVTVPKEEVKKMVTATRGDIKVIEASETIRYLSQKMVRDYLFFYKHQDKQEVKYKLDSALMKLTDNFRVIAATTKDGDTKDILEFLAYSKDQIEQIFTEEANEESVALMLDYSETLLEGADSIAHAHIYNFSDEEKMIMVTKEIEYLLERVTKYYMAIHVGFNNTTNKDQMQESITRLEENLAQVNNYSYPEEFRKIQLQIDESWKANKHFLVRSETLFIPKLIFASVNHMENILAKLALYHTKNQ